MPKSHLNILIEVSVLQRHLLALFRMPKIRAFRIIGYRALLISMFRFQQRAYLIRIHTFVLHPGSWIVFCSAKAGNAGLFNG